MNAKPNLPNEIFWGKEYSWRMDSKVNGWLALAAVISSLTDIIFAHTVKQWPMEARVGIVLAEFLALALWARSVTQWIRGMDELHRRIMTSVMLAAVGATFFFMLLWHCLNRAGLFDVLFGKPKAGGWDIGTVCHGFLLFVLFYGIAQAICNRRYK
ncbi:MAG TPA: hypothetical protein VK815_10235 [Candidatus Acidoferrales bacterium]|nr:hypothetical protein [Candidatus Acidoferrales bacterium]